MSFPTIRRTIDGSRRHWRVHLQRPSTQGWTHRWVPSNKTTSSGWNGWQSRRTWIQSNMYGLLCDEASLRDNRHTTPLTTWGRLYENGKVGKYQHSRGKWTFELDATAGQSSVRAKCSSHPSLKIWVHSLKMFRWHRLVYKKECMYKSRILDRVRSRVWNNA